ncbi:hypothetical protein M3G00_02210 [Brevibacterium casei]|jgi:hypothetical protein|uniref:Uncharacterized protein n=2 Tax=Brevibacterium casei TaxID=33889 RepID=K9AI48_9MICO|nr:hypothetical protein [Brevibacterium casei]EKU46939.1 hypothetical protein C272_09519 [Brevibacterium casei S18]RAA21836.1 hypothetical protein DN465_31475 [Burkholderia multivorans]KZE22849.1 hypothetical protein AVW13_05590 [Brevibacterium casei]MCT1445832.1 hypothetical protein [Brevibacterium casei]MCT1764907.1 hypothetical protein [Brevibacterium casei]
MDITSLLRRPSFDTSFSFAITFEQVVSEDPGDVLACSRVSRSAALPIFWTCTSCTTEPSA